MKRVPLICALLALLSLWGRSHAEDLAESYIQSIYRAQVSIIIDDLGYGLAQGQKLAHTPFPLTLAIIPFTPYGAAIADYAHQHDKEIMLHAPMEPMSKRKWESGLSSGMDKGQFKSTLDAMLKDIPHVKGVNNHGGSGLTQDSDRMSWLMSHLGEQNLYFVDSRTIATSKAQHIAQAARILNASRDIFLDNEKDEGYIREQLHKLANIALQKGRAIGIGHPYPETFATLDQVLPTFKALGIELVTVSQLLKPRITNFQHTLALRHERQNHEKVAQ